MPHQIIRFTKMQGAGNDFIVLDETQRRLGLSPAQYRLLADRHFGVGADQILSVRPAPAPDVDFEYVIHNADGGEVEQCGNGARCFARFVHDKQLTHKERIRVQTRAGVIAPRLMPDGRVCVDMGSPRLHPAQVPFTTDHLQPQLQGQAQQWPLPLSLTTTPQAASNSAPEQQTALVTVLSMGNPHAVLLVHDVALAPVATWGPYIENHPRFVQRVNVGFLQVLDRRSVKLRVYERGTGETLACGTGACAAAVAGMRLGLLDDQVDVHTHGGILTIAWSGQECDAVFLTGPATTVFEGEIILNN